MRPEIDDKDRALLAARNAKRAEIKGPCVGDFIIMLDGTTRRFTHNWGDGLQTTYRWRETGEVTAGSFFYDRDGHGSYSGSLDEAIPLSRIVDTGEQRDGDFWFFHHDHMKAHNGVYVKAPCRVFKETA